MAGARARVVEPTVVVKPTWVPPPLRVLRRLDDALYALGAPQILEVLVALLVLVLVVGFVAAR